MLNTSWDMYFHENANRKWNDKSYEKFSSIQSADDFWSIMNNLHQAHLLLTGIYFMRYNEKPSWEDQINGSTICISIQGVKDDAIARQFGEIVARVDSNTFLTKNNHYINGVSITTKSTHVSYKIWCATQDNLIEYLHPSLNNTCNRVVHVKNNKD